MSAAFEADRAEVMIATAWGLRILSIPETAPAMLDVATRQANGSSGGTVDLRDVDLQMAHLFEALGLLNYRPAEPLMREYIPIHPARSQLSRGAAIWALGHLYAGEANEDLAGLFMGRATDPSIMPPEFEFVRAMSVVSIARMQAESQLDGLRELIGTETDHNQFDYGLRWALREMTGEDVSLAPPVVLLRTGWYVEPLTE